MNKSNTSSHWILFILGSVLIGGLIFLRAKAAIAYGDFVTGFERWDTDAAFMQRPSTSMVVHKLHRTLAGMVLLTTFGIGAVRALRHPASPFQSDYLQWLRTTPWRPEQALPFNPCTPRLKELLTLLMLEGLLWWHPSVPMGSACLACGIGWLLFTSMILFASCRALSVSLILLLILPMWFCQQPPWHLSWVMTYGIASLASIFAAVRFGFPRSFALMITEEPSNDLERNQWVATMGTPMGTLAPVEIEHLGSRQFSGVTSSLMALMLGGFFQAYEAVQGELSTRWALPWIGITFICVASMIYRKDKGSPLDLRARVATRRWIIPVIDRQRAITLIAGLSTFGIAHLAPGSSPSPIWGALACFIGLLILTLFYSPQREWTLAGPGRLRPGHAEKNLRV